MSVSARCSSICYNHMVLLVALCSNPISPYNASPLSFFASVHSHLPSGANFVSFAFLVPKPPILFGSQLLVKEAEARKNSSNDEGGSSTHINLNSDELDEVFGRDTRGRVRGVSSHISRKKLQKSVVTTVIVQQSNSLAYNDVKADVAELKNTITRVEGMMEAIYHKTYANSEPEFTQIPTDEILRTTKIGLNFINKKSTISPTTYNVMLLDRDGNEVAKEFVVTDPTCGICHNRKVLPGEKNVETVLIGGAYVYDGPHDGNSLMEGFTDGDYLIWLGACLQKLS